MTVALIHYVSIGYSPGMRNVFVLCVVIGRTEHLDVDYQRLCDHSGTPNEDNQKKAMKTRRIELVCSPIA